MRHDVMLNTGLTMVTGGELSGASQPHKHLQLIPIDADGPPVEKLARSKNIEVLGAYRRVYLEVRRTEVLLYHRTSICP